MMKKAWVSALRMLAIRRLTESQLRIKLERKEFPDDEIALVVERAKAEKFIDDRLFATLYLDSTAKCVGDRRLVADLVKRGIDRELALAALAECELTEEQRLAQAYSKLSRMRPDVSMPSAARALERKGFAASTIYRFLRTQTADVFSFEDSL